MIDDRKMSTLYKIDENDKVREWFIQLDGNRYCVHSGVQGGKTVVSKWKEAKPKNVGKANEVCAEQQAILEVERKYVEQKKTGGYYDTVELAREGFKTYFQPMLAEKWKDRKPTWGATFPLWSQPKLDGCRAVSTYDALKSREGEAFITPTKIIKIMKRLHEIYPSYVFDGELYNHKYRNDFEKIVSLIRKQKPTEAHIEECNEKIEYHIYDMFDRNRPDLPFSERFAILQGILHDFDERIVLVETKLVHNEEELDALYGEYLENEFEGQMVRVDGPYEMRRSKTLLKRKEFEDAEFQIESVEEGEGNWSGALKVVWIELEDGRNQKATPRGTYDDLAALLKEADSLPGTDVTVRFQGRTGGGKLRFPIVTVFWRGKRDV
ncbi:DNA ligase [Sinorhizobium phage phiM7]|uniref:DNA ligase n=2 Tax=Emdodecavirus TaxID=1980937 RepID=S5MQD0_9CAUD|nr:DNA ligase [Sinorhizobium phage phiM12]YP_009601451.1 DNA ligase [Sinorhizobium phage phiM7]AGR48050.2 DNA ligase [Sinorhizobium phage phiM12]AKF12871.1 DNA ligase [Sinorhizobium phage phiM7]AKF13231.1 DNA ligase [Sinorhizobium phage phiM19]